jgi:hypothetical protein
MWKFLVLLGFELTALHLLGRHSTTPATPGLFDLAVFPVGLAGMCRPAWTVCDHPIYASHVTGMTVVLHNAQPFL